MEQMELQDGLGQRDLQGLPAQQDSQAQQEHRVLWVLRSIQAQQVQLAHPEHKGWLAA